jgi:2-oxoglutarate ferredoxin oxidoreductase subunit alpha
MADSDVSIAFVGSGGAGVLTTGAILLEAACAAGWHGFLTRSVGAQIRGGEAAALIRLAPHPIDCHTDCFDLLIGVDWRNAQRFDAEIPLGPRSLVIGDPQGGARPQGVAAAGARAIDVPFKDMLRSQPDWRANMIALGIAAKLIGLSEDVLRGLLNKRFGAKGPAAFEANLAAVNAGAAAADGLAHARYRLPPALSPSAG